jgi:hypothetical protein
MYFEPKSMRGGSSTADPLVSGYFSGKGKIWRALET